MGHYIPLSFFMLAQVIIIPVPMILSGAAGTLLRPVLLEN